MTCAVCGRRWYDHHVRHAYKPAVTPGIDTAKMDTSTPSLPPPQTTPSIPASASALSVTEDDGLEDRIDETQALFDTGASFLLRSRGELPVGKGWTPAQASLLDHLLYVSRMLPVERPAALRVLAREYGLLEPTVLRN